MTGSTHPGGYVAQAEMYPDTAPPALAYTALVAGLVGLAGAWFPGPNCAPDPVMLRLFQLALDRIGRVVVEIPEPDHPPQSEDEVRIWTVGKLDVEAWWPGEVALMWGEDGNGGDGRILTAGRARALAAALLAAADEHERLSGSRKDGETHGQ